MKKTVYVVNYEHISHEIFYNIHEGFDERRKFTVYLREEIESAGYRFEPTHGCEKTDPSGYILALRNVPPPNAELFNNIARHPRERCILFNPEPWHLTSTYHLYSEKFREVFGTHFLLFDDWVDNKNYFKAFHPQSRETQVEEKIPFAQKKICVMIQTNYNDREHSVSSHHSLYDKRGEAAEFFGRRGELELFGRFWYGNPAWSRLENLMIKDKLPLLKFYKFCLCYENMRHQFGYITERIFECFYGRCVPIYWGASNITDYIPKECFVDRRDFASNEALLDFMKSMSEETYNRMIHAAEDFIKSPQAKPFSARSVAKHLVRRIDQLCHA